MFKLNRYPIGDLVWGTATESAFCQKLKLLSVLFVVLVSSLETQNEVPGKGLLLTSDDKLSQCITALVNVGVVGDAGSDYGHK